MTAQAPYRTAIADEWIDYNGHLRDAYYSLIFSQACDALMDRLGLDEAYRIGTRCTLYTLETHLHFLHEVKRTDMVEVGVRILGADHKRIHAAFDMRCARYPDPVATMEMMLLHVHRGQPPRAQAFPPEIAARLTALTETAAAVAAPTAPAASSAEAATNPNGTATGANPIPGSRRMDLRNKS